MTDARPSLLQFRRLRDAWHVLMAELWGVFSGYALLNMARHANKAHDVVTVYRVAEVVRRGVEVGWDESSPDSGKVVANRDREVAEKARQWIEDVPPRGRDRIGI